MAVTLSRPKVSLRHAAPVRQPPKVAPSHLATGVPAYSRYGGFERRHNLHRIAPYSMNLPEQPRDGLASLKDLPKREALASMPPLAQAKLDGPTSVKELPKADASAATRVLDEMKAQMESAALTKTGSLTKEPPELGTAPSLDRGSAAAPVGTSYVAGQRTWSWAALLLMVAGVAATLLGVYTASWPLVAGGTAATLAGAGWLASSMSE